VSLRSPTPAAHAARLEAWPPTTGGTAEGSVIVSTAAHPAGHAAEHPAAHTGIVARGLAGAVAGLVGGLVFGVLMAMMGVLPMVGMLVGVEDAAVGFFVHLVNSAVIGAIFGVLAWRFAARLWPALGAGAVYGVIWWVLGALTLMPLWLSFTADAAMRDMVFVVERDQWMSLMGHLLYGLVTALVLFGLHRRRP
jgi:hypothetical protein